MEKPIEIDGNDSEMEQIEDEEFKCCVCLNLTTQFSVMSTLTSEMYVDYCTSYCRNCTHWPTRKGKCKLQKKSGYSSPQFTEHLHAAPQTAPSNIQSNSLYSDKLFPKAEDPSFSVDLSKTFIPANYGCSEVASNVQKASEVSSSEVVKECALTDDSSLHESQKYFSLIDVSCPACKNMLFRPRVLNCVHCESCLEKQQNGVLKCQVCLVLEHFIADQFQEQYVRRREFILKQAEHVNGSSSNSPAQRTIQSEANQL